MTLEQCEKRNEAIMQEFERLKQGQDVSLDYTEILIVCAIKGVNVPQYLSDLVEVHNRNSIRCTGNERRIFKFLDRICKE